VGNDEAIRRGRKLAENVIDNLLPRNNPIRKLVKSCSQNLSAWRCLVESKEWRQAVSFACPLVVLSKGEIMVLQRIGVLSCGKIMGILYAGMGLIVGAFFAIISLAGIAIPQQNAAGNPMAFMLIGGVAALIFMPIMYGIMGFIGGIIMAALYNLVASLAGGLELEFRSNGPDYMRQ
jgi:hypothetical protein